MICVHVSGDQKRLFSETFAYKMYDAYRNFQNRFKTLQGEEKASHDLALLTPFPDNGKAKVMKICLLLEKLAIVFYIIMISILSTSLKHQMSRDTPTFFKSRTQFGAC